VLSDSKIKVMCTIVYLVLATMLLFLFLNQWTWAQPATPDEFVTYEKKSSFIKEFTVPFEELGLRGVITDPKGNVWFYHSTNVTSILVMFESDSNKFTEFPVEGETAADNPIINLASSQLAFDSKRNAVWFTDARTNSIGKLDVASGQIDLLRVPTDGAGPMGIALSPDGNTVWFAEITGDKIASVDAESMEIVEYSTGENSGPALLTFDDSDILWVTLSFSNSVLRIDPQALSSNNPSAAMTELKLSGEDAFSPLGIAVAGDKVYVSDHGSSRVTVSDTGFVNYVSYWTSPSVAFPTTLPSQVVADSRGNIYFPQHGGNRISVIDEAGVMTEYEIPTGPLSTVVFIAASDDGRVWFTEWASNKIAYLDTSIQVPFTLNVEETALTLDASGPQSIAVSLSSSEAANPVSLSEVEVGLTGMTDSGLGVTYEAQPPRVNLQDAKSAESEIQIKAKENARPGSYTAMIRALVPEQDGLVISKLYPIELTLDVPGPASGQGSSVFENQQSDTIVQDVLRIGAPLGAAVVVAFAIYRWKKAKSSGVR
jgi:streptogramin lyase